VLEAAASISPGTGTGKGRPAAPSDTDGSDSDVRRRRWLLGKGAESLGWLAIPVVIFQSNRGGRAALDPTRSLPPAGIIVVAHRTKRWLALLHAGREAARPHAMPAALHPRPRDELPSRVGVLASCKKK
jgi:hypothetical protein